MDLPLATSMAYGPPTDAYSRVRQLLQWTLVAFCFVVTIIQLEPPCSLGHKNLNSIHQAKVEFHGSSSQEPKQQQYWKWPQDPDSCAAKVRDINSWPRAESAQPPFTFPKVIHQTVEDKSNISCEVLECMQTWKDLNPGYEHRLWDAKDRELFIRKRYPELYFVYITLSTNVERADLWRYLALHKHGGVYADSDVRCIKPIQDWNTENNHDADLLVGVVYTDDQGMVTRVNNFIIAAMPCHPVMAAMPFTAMSRIAAAGLQGKSVGGEQGQALSEAVIGRTGPAALTATIGDHAKRIGAEWPVNGTAGAEGAGAGNLVSTVRLLPRNIFTMGWETAAEKISCEEAYKRNPGAYICHQYFGTWKASYNHRPALTYSPNCTYWGINGTAGAGGPDPQDPVGKGLAAVFKTGLATGHQQAQQPIQSEASDGQGGAGQQQAHEPGTITGDHQQQFNLSWQTDSSAQQDQSEQQPARVEGGSGNTKAAADVGMITGSDGFTGGLEIGVQQQQGQSADTAEEVAVL